MRTTKRLLALIVATALLASIFVTAIPLSVSAAYDNSNTYTITGFDTTPPEQTHGSIYVYPNTGSSTRIIKASDYSLRYSKLMIFNASGKLIEAGENIYPNSDTVTGSPQLTVSVPAGGFMVAFGTDATGLVNCYNVAMEGAMLYNATMSVIYDVHASYNKSTNKLTVEYNNPKTPSASAKKFMVVGNSTTYFNGIPIKFKGIAQAAGMELDVTYCTKGSSYLYQYADATTDCGTKFRNLLKEKSFDYVVLQDAGKAVYSQSKPAMDTLMPLITANGAKAVLYKRYASESNEDERLAHAQIHHENYTQLAEDFNIDMVAPVADAFLISDLKYPEINLYADDNSHHSKEGSYLAALVWAITYLGIDISNNSYTADLPDDTVAALKECAILACEVGYFEAPSLDTYENLTLGNKYTISAEPPSGAPDTDNKELTDGIVAKDIDMTSPYYSDARWVGLSFSNSLREVEIVMPLGDGKNVSELSKVTVNAGTASVTGGCHEPSFTVYYTVDGTNYYNFGTHTSTDASSNIAMNFTVSSDTTVRATHIKLVFTPYTGNVCRISEISAYGYKTNLQRINAGSSYTISVAPPTGNAGDTDNKELTDGEIVRNCDIASTKYNDNRWVGLSFSSSVRTVDVVMPLGDGQTPVKLSEVSVNFGTDAIGAGVTEPSIIVYASADGTNYKEFGRYDRVATTTKFALDVSIAGPSVMATHIKVSFSLISGKNVCRVGEIAAFSRSTVTENVSKGSDYTLSAEPPSGAPDPDLTKLTDGKVVSHNDIVSPYYKDSRWVGMGFSSTIREVTVHITLDSVREFNKVVVNMGSEKIGAGVMEPGFSVLYSENGTNYYNFGSYTRSGDTTYYVINAEVSSSTLVKAKYVKVVFTFHDNNTTCRIGEISVYGNSHDHTVDDIWETDESKHWHECSCGEKFFVGDHSEGQWETVLDAKLHQEGRKELKCTVCGYLIDTDTIPALHNFSDEFTYDELGHWYGCTCNEQKDYEEHIEGEWETVDPAGIHKEGLKELRCTVCKYLIDSEVIPEKHESATQWSSDENNHWHECSCGEKFDVSQHTNVKWVITDPAGFHKEGKQEFRCMDCGHVLMTGTVSAEHNYDSDWKYDEIGHWKECSCGESEETIYAHEEGEWVTITPATAEEKGLKKKFCTVCNKELASEDIPKLTTDDTNVLKGDINNNGQIDSMDYVLLKRAYFGTYVLSDIKVGDINSSGVIDSMDYVLLKRAYFGTYTIK